jgi:hypothetical protein
MLKSGRIRVRSKGSLDSFGKLAAMAGVAPPLRQIFAYIPKQQLPPAIRDLLRRLDRRAETAMTTPRKNPEPLRAPVPSLAFCVSIATILLIAATLVRRSRRPHLTRSS